MVMANVRKCDIYGTFNDVRKVKVTITVEGEKDAGVYERDMCPRAIKRLKGFLDRGTTPSKP